MIQTKKRKTNCWMTLSPNAMILLSPTLNFSRKVCTVKIRCPRNYGYGKRSDDKNKRGKWFELPQVAITIRDTSVGLDKHVRY